MPSVPPSAPALQGPARASPVEGVGDAGMGASVALQRAVASSVLRVWTMPPSPGAPDDVPLGDVLDLAEAAAPSRLPLQP